MEIKLQVSKMRDCRDEMVQVEVRWLKWGSGSSGDYGSSDKWSEVAQAELKWLKWRCGGSSGSKVVLLEVKCLKWMGCGLKNRWDGLSEGEGGQNGGELAQFEDYVALEDVNGSSGGNLAQEEMSWHK